MSEEIKSTETMEESFEELLNQSFKTLNTGEKVTGIVTAITPTEVQVDVGAKQYAYIKLSELSDDPSAKPEDIVKVGDEVRLRVDGFDQILTVTKLLVKGVGAPQARVCYEDLTPPRPKLFIPVAQRERGTGRPSKKERRELDRLRGRDSHEHARLDHHLSDVDWN